MTTSLQEKEQQLRLKNKLLDDKRRELEEELDHMQLNHAPLSDDEEYPHQEPQPEEEQPPQDMIGELEAINKIQQQRNKDKHKDLKETQTSNIKTLLQQKKQIESLQKAAEEAARVYELKIDMVRELENKGKKLSEESKKWITDITKLSEKSEQLRTRALETNRDWEGLYQQTITLGRNLKASEKEKQELMIEANSFDSKVNNLNEQITQAKQHLKANAQEAAQDATLSNKEAQRLRINQKRLQRQKAQLIRGFRKLQSYISLLRKQQLHIQTVRSLNFSLQEFLQGVDKGDRI